MICVNTDVGMQTETAAQALYSEGVRINSLYFLYYIFLHINAGCFTPCSSAGTLDSI